MKSCIVACVVIFTLMLVSVNSFGDSLRKVDYISAGIGIDVFGDPVIDDIFGPFFNISGAINKKVTDSISLLGRGLYSAASGDTQGVDVSADKLNGAVSMVYLLFPSNAITPYLVAGGLFQYAKIEAVSGNESIDEDDSDIGFELGGGIEFDLGQKTLLDIFALYQSAGDFDAFGGGANFGYALNAKTILTLGGDYSFDEEDYGVHVGVAFKL